MKKNDLQKIVGKNLVIDDTSVLEGYSRDHSFAPPQTPALVVMPSTTEELKSIVGMANRQGGKLVPVSSGPPRFRGDTVPSLEGAVVVDMSRMKEIMWVNRRNRVALVEAGVTFGELEPELEREGMRCMMPLAPRSTKSVVGAYLEREPFTVPKYSWDLGDPIASSEFILGDGNLLRSGGGAGPGSLEEQREVGGAQKSPLGPFNMDARRIAQGSQGGIGICSWISLRCELLPQHERVYFVGAERLEDLLDLLYRTLYLRLVDEQYILNSLNLACLLAKEPEEIEDLRSNLPNWILVTSIGGYGELPQKQFDYKDADIRDEAERLGMKLLSEMGGISEADYRAKVIRKTSEEPYWKLRYSGDCRELFFLTSASRTPEFAAAVEEKMKKEGLDPESVGVYIQMVIQGKACHCEFDLYSTPEDAAKLEGPYMEMGKELFGMGAYFSRPYGALSDIVYGHDGYATFVKYARGLKEIFDPNQVLNPGKLCFKGM